MKALMKSPHTRNATIIELTLLGTQLLGYILCRAYSCMFHHSRAEANGGPGAERPPGDHLSENVALLSEFL